jgi:hypothetical protein
MTAQTKIEWTRVRSDVNGNPRYVCHFLNLNTQEEIDKNGKDWIDVSTKYQIAVKRANKIGGRKFHNKQYGGGIVFQSYSLIDTERSIFELLEKRKSEK